MYRRIVLILVPAFVAVLSLGVLPAGYLYANAVSSSVYLDRIGDVTRISGLLSGEAGQHDGVTDEIGALQQLYGMQIVVVGRHGNVLTSSQPSIDLRRPKIAERLRILLAGRQLEPHSILTPWQPPEMVLGQPLMTDGDIRGAVVAVAPVHKAQSRIRTAWLLLVVVVVVGGGLAVLVARRLAVWVTRPMTSLGAAIQHVQEGDYTVRVQDGRGLPETRALAVAFNKMAEHVEAAQAAQREFVANAGHQLYNPLNALTLRLDSLAMSLDSCTDPDPARAAREASAEGHELTESLNSLIQLTRVEYMEPVARQQDLAAVVDRRLCAWELVAERRGVSFRRLGCSHLLAYFDSAAIAGSLDALLNNAVKYSPDGATVDIDVGVTEDRHHALVRVQDRGPGVPPADVPRLTERFWRGQAQASVPGTGLGLAIASTLMRRFGGELKLSADQGEGLCAQLLVPLEASEAVAASAGVDGDGGDSGDEGDG